MPTAHRAGGSRKVRGELSEQIANLNCLTRLESLPTKSEKEMFFFCVPLCPWEICLIFRGAASVYSGISIPTLCIQIGLRCFICYIQCQELFHWLTSIEGLKKSTRHW